MIGGELLRPGGAPHFCDKPSLNLSIRHGCVWRCECGRRWKLHVTAISQSSYSGEWRRLWWPWPR